MIQWSRRTLQDSLIENWTVPADGHYTIEVRDVHLRGGAEYVYGLEITRATPRFDLVMDTDKSWLTGSNSKGSITLTAAKDAKPVDHQQCCIMANVSINFVMKATYSSRPIAITVLAPGQSVGVIHLEGQY